MQESLLSNVILPLAIVIIMDARLRICLCPVDVAHIPQRRDGKSCRVNRVDTRSLLTET